MFESLSLLSLFLDVPNATAALDILRACVRNPMMRIYRFTMNTFLIIKID